MKVEGEGVIAEYGRLLDDLIDYNSDDVHDLASWAAALAETAARMQRRVTALLIKQETPMNAKEPESGTATTGFKDNPWHPWTLNPHDYAWDGGAPTMACEIPGSGYALTLIVMRERGPAGYAKDSIVVSLMDENSVELATADFATVPIGIGPGALRAACHKATLTAVGLLYPGDVDLLYKAADELERLIASRSREAQRAEARKILKAAHAVECPGCDGKPGTITPSCSDPDGCQFYRRVAIGALAWR